MTPSWKIWLFTLVLLPVAATARDLPNIVLLVADDLGYGELIAEGADEIPTPGIDSIGERGVRFTNGYVTASYCSASRAGFMTGKYQTRFGYEFNPTGHHNDDPDAGLPSSEITLAEFLLEAGYVSGLVGKWHLGGAAAYHPFRHGFDEFFGFTHEGHYFVPPPYTGVTTMERRVVLPGGGEGRWESPDGRMIYTTHMGHNEPDYDANNPIMRGGQPVEEKDFLTEAFTMEATDFIARNQDRPFFLYVAYNAVHSPLQAQDRHMEKFAHIEDIHRRIFAGMVAGLDESVEQILMTLRKTGLEEDTLVFFFSDNGGPTRELTSSNGALRGEKGHVYDGGLRVPFYMQWPGQVPAGQEFEEPVISLDVFGTMAAVAGKEARGIDGVNLLPYLKGEKEGAPHEELFWRMGPKAALRAGDWKIVRQPERGRGGPVEWELYNLADDIGESNNLAASNPEKLQELVKRWEAKNEEMEEPFWKPNRR